MNTNSKFINTLRVTSIVSRLTLWLLFFGFALQDILFFAESLLPNFTNSFGLSVLVGTLCLLAFTGFMYAANLLINRIFEKWIRSRKTICVYHVTTENYLKQIQSSLTLKGKSSTSWSINPIKKLLYFLLDGNQSRVWVSLGQPINSRTVTKYTTGVTLKENNKSVTFELDTEKLHFPNSLKCLFGLNQLVVKEQINLPTSVIVKSWTGNKWE